MSLLRHSAQYLVARGIPAIINFIAIAVYTRLLSPAEYGSYILGLSAATVGNAIFFQWLHLGVIRYWARYRAEPGLFLSTIAFGFGITALTVAGVAGVAFWFLRDTRYFEYLPLVVLLLWAWSFAELNLALRNAQTRPRDFGILAAARSAMALAVGGLLAALGGGAAGVLWGWVIGISAALVLFAARDWRSAVPGRSDPALMRRLLSYGVPLTASFALAMVVTTTDRVLLAYLRGADEAGLYAAGYDLSSQVLTVLMMIVSLAAYPLVVRALETDGYVAARRELSTHAVLLFAIAIPAATGLMVLASTIGDTVLGAGFKEAAEKVMPIVALAYLLAGVKAYYFDLAFQLGQRPMGQVWVLLAAALLNVVLNFALIPPYGLLGAAWATVAAYAAGLCMSVIFGRQWFLLPFPTVDLLKILGASLLMCLVLWPLRSLTGVLGLSTAIMAGAATYAVCALALDISGVRRVLYLRLKSRTPGP